MKSRYTRRQLKTAMFLLIVLLFLFLVYALQGFITSFFGALIIYTLFRPWHEKLVEERKWRPSVSSAVILVVSFLLIILPVAIVVSQVTGQVIRLGRNPQVFATALTKLQNLPYYDRFVDPNFLQNQLSRAGQYALNIFSTTLNGLANSVATIGVMYLLLYFMFAEYKGMENWLRRYLPFSLRNSVQYARELRNITYSNVIGSGIVATVQGTLVGIGFWIFGVPQPFFYGLIAVFASFIPIIGAALIFVPGSLYCFATGNNFGGIGLLAWGFVLVANIDNLLRMVLNKRLGDTHPLITFLGIIVGLPLFGLTGLVIGPLLLAFFVLSVRIYTNNYLSSPEDEPLETRNADVEARNVKSEQATAGSSTHA
ncbi:MAG: AI-2E family transporter [Cytophagales bacterium]|jgi:predicted PurR-regulated permease PerM|nr:AI-2E family transporter [Cytophagales bacterium]